MLLPKKKALRSFEISCTTIQVLRHESLWASWKFEKRLPKYGKSVLWMPERWRKVHEWEKDHLSTLLQNDATKGTLSSFSKKKKKKKLRRRRKICPYRGAGQMFQL